MKTITKKDVIQKIAGRKGLDPREVRLAIQDFLEYLTESLQKGNRFEFRDFGVFEVVERKAKVGRNPKVPGTSIIIPAQNVVKFTPGKKLKTLMIETENTSNDLS